MSKVEELSEAILRTLLTDFADRNCTADDLATGYEGVSLATLKETYCGEMSASPVDFDLALKDLEHDKLVETGPMDFFQSPGILGFFSKQEYAYLNEKGYKAAQKVRSTRSPLKDKKRFAVGAKIRVQRPGLNGVVTRLDENPTALGEYWHTIQTESGERREPGCNLELIPIPMTNSETGEMPKIGKRRGQAFRR